MNKVVHKNCKFRNVCGYLIFANSVKRHICHVDNSRPGHDLPTDRVILPFCKGFVFILMKINPCVNFRIYNTLFIVDSIQNAVYTR